MDFDDIWEWNILGDIRKYMWNILSIKRNQYLGVGLGCILYDMQHCCESNKKLNMGRNLFSRWTSLWLHLRLRSEEVIIVEISCVIGCILICGSTFP